MKKVLLFSILTLLAGCGSGDTATSSPASGVFDKYVATWLVNYSGSDKGKCTLKVPETASQTTAAISGICRSTDSGVEFNVAGGISFTEIIEMGKPPALPGRQ